MGVKGIFKAIIGTMTIMITSFFLIEYYNISVAAPQLKTLTQVALRQSCQFFAQESYKNGSGNAYQLVGKNGFTDSTLNGRFYAATPEQTYQRLYRNSSEFKAYINQVRAKLGNKTWRNLNLLGYAMGYGYSGSLKSGENKLAKYYLDDMLTPLNIGVIYLDKSTLTNIFRWELVNILRNGEQDMIIPASDPTNSGANYVLYKGFRLYYNTIRVKNINYTIYDLYNAEDTKKFEALTNIKAAEYKNKANIQSDDERRYVAIATLDYGMQVAYEGITPVQRAFQWAFNREATQNYVAGDPLNSVRGRNSDSWDANAVGGETTLSTVGARNNELFKARSSDNFNNSSGGYNLDNTIIYYIIR